MPATARAAEATRAPSQVAAPASPSSYNRVASASHTPPPASPALASPPAPPARAFAFGVEYALPGLAQVYARAGARSTRAAAETFGWSEIEPNPPRAPRQHDYAWSKVDRYITEYQNAGFDQIQIYTTAFNRWASSKPKHHVPDERFLDDYEDYIFNLVERYDADGEADAPGLKAPVLDYVVEREWTEFFPGTTDEYLGLLAIAHRAIKRANQDARVWLVPFMMIDVFDRGPGADEIARRSRVNYTFRHPMVETQRLLTHPELFDVVEIHSLGDYTELDATAAWLRGEMQANGYDKPIFIGDALGISQGIWANGLGAFTPNAKDSDFLTFAPLRPNDALRFINLLEAMRDGKSAERQTATRWFRAEHARAVPKKIAAAINAGYAGMNLWALADLPALQQPRVTANWFFMGMVDAQMGLGTFTPGPARPAYYALELTIGKLNAATSAERLEAGPTVVAYRFVVDGRPIIVAWNEPGRLYFPGESEPAVAANVPVSAESATVTRLITEIGTSAPRVETVRADGGAVALTLDSTPVFIEPGQ
jgi:hypothetical protein